MKTILIVSGLCLCSLLGHTQITTVTGRVTNELGQPIKGAKVIALGKQLDVETDAKGQYQLEVSIGEDLVFKYPDYSFVKAKVYGNYPVHITMSPGVLPDQATASISIEGSMDVGTQRRDTNEIGQESFQENVQTDFTRILSGKTAGLQVLSRNGFSGSFNRVVIRGIQTVTGDNGALYVIDGVPYSHDMNADCFSRNGSRASSRSFDIDPNNILKVRILKGLAATNLYGSEGKNGVILITTKSGGITTR